MIDRGFRITWVIPFVILILLCSICSPLSWGLETQISTGDDKCRVPSYLQVGDILFCDIKPKIAEITEQLGFALFSGIYGFSNDHCAMYIGNNRFIEACPYRIRPLQLNWLGVVISPLWKIQLWATNITYAYVETNQEIRNDAVQWAKTQLRKPYQIAPWGANPNPKDTSDEYADHWYCSELIWAAYWNQNVKLKVDGGYYQFNATSIGSLKRADGVIWYENKPPTADAGGPYEGMVDERIYFDGYQSSDSDGLLMIYNWSFGDGSYGYGDYSSHVYINPGNYKVILTVKDSGGKFDNDTTTVSIAMKNRAPTEPIIEGNKSGHVDKVYTYSISSTDPDNDTIKYTVDWDDHTKNASSYLSNGSTYQSSHCWRMPGKYTIKVEATDGEITSSTTYTVDIKRKTVSDIYSGEEGNHFQFAVLLIIVFGSILVFYVMRKRGML